MPRPGAPLPPSHQEFGYQAADGPIYFEFTDNHLTGTATSPHGPHAAAALAIKEKEAQRKRVAVGLPEAPTLAEWRRKVRPGMSRAQVNEALGTPGSGEGSVGRSTTAVNAQDGQFVIVMDGGRVASVKTRTAAEMQADTYKIGQLDPGRRRPLYFVPIGSFPAATINELRDYYKRKLNIDIGTLPTIQHGAKEMDAGRHQFVGERLIALIKRRYPKQASDTRSYFIGLTTGDIYTQAEAWRYAFAVGEDHISVVSSARMDPASYGQPADPQRLQTRLRKMVTKRIGLMYCNLPPSSDRHSVLYSPVLSVDDLDSIGEDF